MLCNHTIPSRFDDDIYDIFANFIDTKANPSVIKEDSIIIECEFNLLGAFYKIR